MNRINKIKKTPTWDQVFYCLENILGIVVDDFPSKSKTKAINKFCDFITSYLVWDELVNFFGDYDREGALTVNECIGLINYLKENGIIE